MVSTLKLTKIQIPNSDSDVISLDASTGNITLNKTLGGTSITVQGEGTATTNLQQGLAKSWVNAAGDGSGINDSYNVTSQTDTGSGNTFFTLVNNKTNTNYSLTGGGQISTLSGSGGGAWFHNVQVGSTNGYQIQHFQNGASADPFAYTGITSHGDLA